MYEYTYLAELRGTICHFLLLRAAAISILLHEQVVFCLEIQDSLNSREFTPNGCFACLWQFHNVFEIRLQCV